MATKSFIENKIYTNLADESDIPAEKHREIEQLLLDEISPDPIVFSNELPPDIILSLVPNMSFSGTISKHGRLVVINGRLKLEAGYISTGTQIFQIVNPNYRTADGLDAFCTARTRHATFPPNTALMTAEHNDIFMWDSIGAGTEVYFSFTYTNDQ